MRLCLDIGNSHILGGIFSEAAIIQRFRYASADLMTSDQFGVFLLSFLRENQIEKTLVKQVAICSVAPQLDHAIRSACVKYLQVDPFFLKMGVKTGLKILYKNPQEVGADIIAGCVGAALHFPDNNVIIADLGTATTCVALAKNKAFHGGAILAGLRVMMKALQANTAKLSSVEIVRPKELLGRSTVECLQSGIYYGHLGMMRELMTRITQELFLDSPPKIIGTGGFAYLFSEEKLFDIILPDLVLNGLSHIFDLNND